MALFVCKLERWYNVVIRHVRKTDVLAEMLKNFGSGVQERNWPIVVRQSRGKLLFKDGNDVGIFPKSGEMGCKDA